MIETAFDPVTVTAIGVMLSVIFPNIGLLFALVAFAQANLKAAVVFFFVWLIFREDDD